MHKIKDFDNYYATHDGRIYSFKSNKFLSSYYDNLGYEMVILYDNNGKRKYKRVHNLIYEAFNDYVPCGMCVCHKDENEKNNHLSNLEIGTNSYNIKHAYDNGKFKSNTKCKVIAINKETKEELVFESIRSMCDKLGYNRKTVTSILKERKKTNNYKHEFRYM